MKLRLKELRLAKKLTQNDIADILNVATSTYTHYENGTRQISLELLNNLAYYFDVTVDYILGNEHKKSVKLAADQDMAYVNNTSIALADAGKGINNSDVVFFDDKKIQILKKWLRGTNKDQAFCGTVQGDSMIGANIINGAKLLFIKVEEVVDGQIGLFTVNGEQFLKKYKEYGSMKVLQSANKDYDDIILNEDDSVSFDGLLVMETIEFNK